MKRVKYNLGAGQTKPSDGWVLVDRIKFKAIDIVHDLDHYPWPMRDGSGEHISAVHLLEHITDVPRFMDECWRILNPGGTLYIETPHASHIDMAWSDPTHKHAFTRHTFINYFTLEGVEKFGYCKYAWSIMFIDDSNGLIRTHMMPVPLEWHTDVLLERMKT